MNTTPLQIWMPTAAAAILFDSIPNALTTGAILDAAAKFGLALVILLLWREDRHERKAERKTVDERYDYLIKEFRNIIETNAKALTKVEASLSRLEDACTDSGSKRR